MENEYTPKHYSILNDIVYFIRYYAKNEPIVLWFSLLEILMGALMPLLTIYLPKVALDLVSEGATPQRIALALGMLTLFLVLVCGLKGMASGGKYMYYNTHRMAMMGDMFLKSLKVKYEYQESGRMKGLYWKGVGGLMYGDWSGPSRLVSGTVGIITSILCFLLYSTVIGTLNVWILLLLVALALINYAISMRHIKFEETLRADMAEADKHYQCVKNSMGDVSAAKDIRIFGMQRWMIALRDRAIGEVVAVQRKRSGKNAMYESISFAMSAIRDIVAYGFLILRALQGAVTVSEFVLYFAAIAGFSGFIEGIMENLSELRAATNTTDYLRAYLELPEEELSAGERHIEELKLPVTIEFRNVSFSYKENEEASETPSDDVPPQSGKQVFRSLNLTIRAGEKIALVGVNGAGKTTLVKLLCGMYDPDEGQIFINGIDRSLFPKRELYRLFSIVFQEPLILPFTVLENIAMCKTEEANEARAWEALKKAGLKTVFEERKLGMDSYMTHAMFQEGIELSGGQQQRFLLARALYKDAPVMVLDEPTAALDPIAESEVYENYNKYSEGKTAIFISHRLASTRFSDRIILIEDGELAEMGTHEELMALGGKYAQMYEVQSSYYAEA